MVCEILGRTVLNCCFLEEELIKRIENHPVHILDQYGNLSPSSFIPFCSFGGKKGIMGKRIDGFSTPVCNSFVPKLFNGQLCYEVDLENFKTNLTNIRKGLKSGLVLVLDINKERQSEKYYHYQHKDVRFFLDSLGMYIYTKQ